jgi:hypothetical protein
MKTEIAENAMTEAGEALETDREIRETITGMRPSVLAMSLGLVKMKTKGLYKELDCSSMAQYIRLLCNDTQMDRSSIYNWLCIGEAYLKYKDDLETIGFGDDDGPTKLPYLERALETRPKQEVLENIKNMSRQDFINFSKTPSAKEEAEPFVAMRDGGVFIDGVLAISISPSLDRKTYVYFSRVNRAACKALEEGEIILPVRLRSREEVRRYRRASIRLLNKMRKKQQDKVVV